MAVTIPELDAMVRSFYEGRGEQVGSARRALQALCRTETDAVTFSADSKKLPRLL
jgi:hypothetical protein